MSRDSECSICERLQDLSVELVADGGAEALSFEALSECSGLSVDEIAAHYPTAAAALYGPYEAASGGYLAVLAAGFGHSPSWRDGFERASRPTRRWRQWRLIGSASRGAARP
jgi:hypothetical protein